MAEVYGSERPRRRRGRRLLIVVLVLLVLLGAGLAVLDRFSNSYAENILADKVAEEVAARSASSSPPVVTIAGVPFLTQVLAGKYEEIRIELPDFRATALSGETVRMDLLDIRAQNVQAPLDALRTGQGEVRAGSVTGVGTIDYALLAEATGQEGLKLAEKDGKVVGSAVVPLTRTQQVSVSAVIDLKVVGGKIRVRFSDVTATDLPDTPIDESRLTSLLERDLPDIQVPDLPMNLQLKTLQPLPEGLRVAFGATDVSLAAAGV
ncbi:LmeA family phospholipid-binding protein [Actinoplanes utahensis]|uniref:DUF2993 domain-containing protein n=1 Tax=Actinoplanes utahensis TaxID=1869 RepID=A0A0A6UBP5_ACTUT|nr:DUF2993 domain-containing protein [Actinoplanes utahensis]KHD72493.1 hypothetical protein MB27_39245 [Actinoplanes utahensis]GIF29397.1 hypothetical protein Aut01nite_23830 [Actinoplanes utahensis]